MSSLYYKCSYEQTPKVYQFHLYELILPLASYPAVFSQIFADVKSATRTNSVAGSMMKALAIQVLHLLQHLRITYEDLIQRLVAEIRRSQL